MNYQMNTPEKSNNSKKLLLILIPILLIAVAVLVYFAASSSFEGASDDETELAMPTSDEIYAFFDSESAVSYDLSRFNDDVNHFISNYDEMYANTDAAEQVVTTAQPVSAKTQEYVDKANEMIIRFFADNYNISVSDKLSVLRAMESDFSETGGAIGYYANEGSFGTDGKAVYMSFDITERAESDTLGFYQTYIHETMHYLGSTVKSSDEYGDDAIWTYFTDGFATSVTAMILDSNFEGESLASYINSYSNPSYLVYQMVNANPDIVKLLIDRESHITKAEIESYFNGDASGVTAEDIAKAILISELLSEQDVLTEVQKCIGEYCRSMKPARDAQIKIGELLLVPISKLG